MRTYINTNGMNLIRQRDYVATVAAALKSNDPIVSQTSEELSAQSPPVVGIQAKLWNRFNRALREGDMMAFASWIKDHAKGNCLEIGTRDGASTSAFLLGLEQNGGHLTSIDVDDCSGLWKHPQWTFIRESSLHLRFVEEFGEGKFDLALIDGNHNRDAFVGDLYNCWHWVKPGGMILAHDIVPERGHEFYAVGLREEFYKFVAAMHISKGGPEGYGSRHYEISGKYGMGVIVK